MSRVLTIPGWSGYYVIRDRDGASCTGKLSPESWVEAAATAEAATWDATRDATRAATWDATEAATAQEVEDGA